MISTDIPDLLKIQNSTRQVAQKKRKKTCCLEWPLEPFILSKIAIEMDSMIEIRNGSKSYGNGKTTLLVLDNFTMTINKGSMS